jgi:hypothetical protein
MGSCSSGSWHFLGIRILAAGPLQPVQRGGVVRRLRARCGHDALHERAVRARPGRLRRPPRADRRRPAAVRPAAAGSRAATDVCPPSAGRRQRSRRSARRRRPRCQQDRQQRPPQVVGDHHGVEAAAGRGQGPPFDVGHHDARPACAAAPRGRVAVDAGDGKPCAASQRRWRPLPQARSSTVPPGRQQVRPALHPGRGACCRRGIRSTTTRGWPGRPPGAGSGRP